MPGSSTTSMPSKKATMTVSHEDMMARKPESVQRRIKARAAKMHRAIEGLRALRQLAQISQEQRGGQNDGSKSLTLTFYANLKLR
jgi:hypothetical protein